MLNLYLGFPRHVWLSPFDLPHSGRSGDGKMNVATDLTNSSLLHTNSGGGSDLRQMNNNNSGEDLRHSTGIRSSSSSSSQIRNERGGGGGEMIHMSNEHVADMHQRRSELHQIREQLRDRHGDLSHLGNGGRGSGGNDMRHISEGSNVRHLGSDVRRQVNNSGEVRQMTSGGGGDNSPSSSNVGSPPMHGSYAGERSGISGADDSPPNILSAANFPAVVSQAIQSIASVGPHGSRPHGGGRYQCRVCNAIFLNKSGVQIHAKEVHRGELKPFPCPSCVKSFSSQAQLAQHNRIHTGEKPYKCTFCDKCFKQLSHLQQHLRLHIGERPYKCTIPECGRSFIQLASLRQHIRNHEHRTKNRPYHCDICGKGFVAEVGLMSHSSTQHAMIAGSPVFPCSICHHMFASRDNLMEHIRNKH